MEQSRNVSVYLFAVLALLVFLYVLRLDRYLTNPEGVIGSVAGVVIGLIFMGLINLPNRSAPLEFLRKSRWGNYILLVGLIFVIASLKWFYGDAFLGFLTIFMILVNLAYVVKLNNKKIE